MSLKKSQGKYFLFLGIFAVAFGLFVVRIASLITIERKLHEKEKALRKSPPIQKELSNSSPVAVQGMLGQESKAAGVKQLLSVGVLSDRAGDNLNIQWEGDMRSTLQFLERLQRQLGRCERLSVAGGDGSLLRVDGVFEPAEIGSPAITLTAISSSPLARNVFLPLWSAKKEDNSIQLQAAQSKQELLARQQEQERLEKERKEQEEKNQLEMKKRDLQSSLRLTGIVNNGREPMAFLTAGTQTIMVHYGDMIQEARVTKIDEGLGEVLLDYAGKFQLALKINSQSAGNHP